MPSSLTFADRLRAVPFLRALVPMVAGVVCGTFLNVPFYFWAVAMVICGLAALLLSSATFFARSARFATVYIAFAILFFGAFVARIQPAQPSGGQSVTHQSTRETIFTKMQSAATERLYRLNIPANDLAVAAAMTTGDRAGISSVQRQAYSRTGAAHLLAVSGLHVGIVFLIINALLWFLPFFRGGHIVKNIVAVAAIWTYAAMTGLSPSAHRAAWMFTGAQMGLAMSRTRSTVNIMCATAFVMLAVKPALLLSLSFQLSFLAVAGIIAWFRPLYALVESRWRTLNALWGVLIVGFCASMATMPLVSHVFGTFSPAGVVLNPIVILTAHLVVGFSLVWIIAPVEFLEPVFRWLVGVPVWLQNRIVELFGGVSWMAIEWRMPLWIMVLCYVAMISITIFIAEKPQKIEPFSLLKSDE